MTRVRIVDDKFCEVFITNWLSSIQAGQRIALIEQKFSQPCLGEAEHTSIQMTPDPAGSWDLGAGSRCSRGLTENKKPPWLACGSQGSRGLHAIFLKSDSAPWSTSLSLSSIIISDSFCPLEFPFYLSKLVNSTSICPWLSVKCPTLSWFGLDSGPCLTWWID